MTPSPIAAARGPRLGAAVVFLAACVLGAVSLATHLGLTVFAFPGEALLALAALAALLAVGVWLFRRVRPVRPPSGTATAAAVVWGGVAASGCALIANDALIGVWSKSGGPAFASRWGPALTAPINEEALKIAGVVLIAVAVPAALRGPVDGLILGALAGLGFQVVENAIYALNAVVQAGATAGALSVAQSLVLRVGVSGAGSHWALSAIAGSGVGLLAAARWHPNARRSWAAALALIAAAALHAFFDAPLLAGTLAGLVVKTAVVFVCAAALYLLVRRAYVRRIRRALAVEGEELDLPRVEAVALSRRGGRRRALQRVPAPDRQAAAERQRGILAAAELRAVGGGAHDQAGEDRESENP